MDLEPWMAQIGLGAASVTLFLLVGKSYVNYIGRQLQDQKTSHREELDRLTKSWEARLADATNAAAKWETAASRHLEAGIEDRRQVEKLLGANELIVSMLNAIREEQNRR